MATLYYNAAVNTNWNTLGNWWQNAGFTTPAVALPTVADDVIASASIASNSGAPATCNTFTLNSTGRSLAITLTVANGATFNNNNTNNSTLNGNCTFNNSSRNFGTVNGNCTFNVLGQNHAKVVGNCTFNGAGGNSYNAIGIGVIIGDCTFNGTGGNAGVIFGNATFNDGTINDPNGTVNGNCTFNNTGGLQGGNVFGNATFNNTAPCNGGVITGLATFNDSSNQISGNFFGGVVCNTSGSCAVASAIPSMSTPPAPTHYFNGAVNSDWNTLGNWWQNAACTTPAVAIPDANSHVFVTNSIQSNSGPAAVCDTYRHHLGVRPPWNGIDLIVTANRFIFTGYGYHGGGVHIYGDTEYYNQAFCAGVVHGDAQFFGGSWLANDGQGTILGDATFNDSSYSANGSIVHGLATFNDNSTQIDGTFLGGVVCNTSSSCVAASPPITYSPPTLSVTPTHYFNAAVDTDWNTLGNWWQDADCTIAAIAIPTASDIVYATAGIASNSGDPAACQTFIQFSSQVPAISIDINVTADEFHFYGHSYINYTATITGNVTCYNSSYHAPGATINGDAHFKGRSYCLGAVTGTITIDEYAIQKTLEQYMQHINNSSLSNPAASGPVVAKFLRGVNGVGLLGGA
jgi:hypothetical protein